MVIIIIKITMLKSNLTRIERYSRNSSGFI